MAVQLDRFSDIAAEVLVDSGAGSARLQSAITSEIFRPCTRGL